MGLLTRRAIEPRRARPTRRRGQRARVQFPEYKLAIVAEYENAANCEKGAILRRQRLHSSHISNGRGLVTREP